MTTVSFNPGIKEVLDSILLDIPGVGSGNMFGYPGYYIRDKLFACVYENGVGIMVPEKTADSLVGKAGISYFQPMGRAKIKSWIFIERSDPHDFKGDLPLFITSIEAVSSLA